MPSRHHYLVIFLLSLALLDAQVTATRLMAYRFFYHFVFFVVSASQLGLAAAGAWVYASERDEYDDEDLRRWLLVLAVAVLSTVVAYVALTPRPVIYLKVAGLPAILYLLGLSLPLLLLNFAGGMCLTIFFARFRHHVDRLYATDLAGAAAGCLVAVALMKYAGPPRAFLAAGWVALGCAEMLGRRLPPEAAQATAPGRPRLGSRGMRLAVAALLAIGTAFPWLADPNLKYGLYSLIHRVRWDHLARTDAIEPGVYIIDGASGTQLELARAGWGESPRDLIEYTLAAPRPRVAVLGAGAGPQVLEAIVAGASHIHAVDINEAVIDWTLNEDKMIGRRIYHRPDVTPLADEARHFMRSTTGPFDVVSMMGLDTFSASAQGAYAMAENFVYTVEAFEEYLDKLAPGGVMAIRRWLFTPPRENLRIFTTALAALEGPGATDAGRHLVVLAPTASYGDETVRLPGYVLLYKTALTDAQLTRLDEVVQRLDWTYLYRPGSDLATPFHQYVAAPDRHAWAAGYPYLIEPTTDAAPYFFQMTLPWSKTKSGAMLKDHSGPWAWLLYHQSSVTLLVTLVASMLGTAVLLGVPLARRRQALAAQRGLGTAWVYFTCLGVGFMGVELPVIQTMSLFLGHPTYALGVVLAGLLAATGLGSRLSRKVPPARVPLALGVVAVVAMLSGRGLLALAHAWIGWPLAARIVVCLVVVGLVGVPLGLPFAAGVARIEDEGPHKVAWAWASNGAAGVVGSCAITIVMIYVGNQAALAVAAACYLVAAVTYPRLAAPASGSSAGAGSGSEEP